MLVQTSRFGELEVAEDFVLEFPRGLYGFEDMRAFFIITPDPDSPFQWLQSIERPELAFVIATPFGFFPDYDIVVDDMDIKDILSSPADIPDTLCIVTARKQPMPVTMNLKAPLLISRVSRKGCQVIIADNAYGTRHELPLASKGSGEVDGRNACIDQKNG